MLTLLKLLLSLSSSLADYLGRRQLLKAGEAKAIADNLYDTLQKLNKADAARRAVKHDPDSVREDPDNRDGW